MPLEPIKMAWCRSCRAIIFWTKWASGKKMPVDYKPVPDGNLVIRRLPSCILVQFWKEEYGDALPRYTSHFATCPDAQQHRKGEQRKEPSPPAPPPSQPSRDAKESP